MSIVVIKVGTRVLSTPDGDLDQQVFSSLVEQVIGLMERGIQVILVSSGAVGASRALVSEKLKGNKVVKRQMMAAIGQSRLIQLYRDLFFCKNVHVAQVLTTKDDFRSRRHYVNMKTCFEGLLKNGIIPIVNENDVVAVEELMFTDNDELAVLIASMVLSERLIILTAEDGVREVGSDGELGPVISELSLDDDRKFHPARVHTGFGRGGITTKIRMAKRAAKLGIPVTIANGKDPHILQKLFNGDAAGTTIPPVQAKSKFKNWLALLGPALEKGAVVINEGAVKKIREPHQVASILPVGIMAVEGSFKKGDIIAIKDSEGRTIGIGKARYGSKKANSYKGTRNKAIVHYDYLYIE